MKLRKPSKQELCKDGKSFLLAAALCGLFIGIMNRVAGGTCWLRLLTGLPCPACGFTRACALLIKGDATGAWHMHAMVFPVLFGVLLFLFSKYFLENGRKIWKGYGIILVIIAIVYYVWRMVRFFPQAEPMIFYSRNLLAGLLHTKH